MGLVLDAGAFIAVERGNREVLALAKAELRAGRVPLTHGGVVGQVWRGGSGGQALLASVLAGMRVVPLDEAMGKRAGVLLRATGTGDVIDAVIALIARDGDLVLTSDPDDLALLAEALGVHVDIVTV